MRHLDVSFTGDGNVTSRADQFDTAAAVTPARSAISDGVTRSSTSTLIPVPLRTDRVGYCQLLQVRMVTDVLALKVGKDERAYLGHDCDFPRRRTVDSNHTGVRPT